MNKQVNKIDKNFGSLRGQLPNCKLDISGSNKQEMNQFSRSGNFNPETWKIMKTNKEHKFNRNKYRLPISFGNLLKAISLSFSWTTNCGIHSFLRTQNTFLLDFDLLTTFYDVDVNLFGTYLLSFLGSLFHTRIEI